MKLKYNILKLIIFLLVLISCNKKSSNLEFQNQTKIENGISDKLIYDFVNEILSQNGHEDDEKGHWHSVFPSVYSKLHDNPSTLIDFSSLKRG